MATRQGMGQVRKAAGKRRSAMQDIRQAPLQFKLRKVGPVYHGWRRVIYSWAMMGILGFATLLMLKNVWSVYGRSSEARVGRDEAELRLTEQTLRKSKLEAAVQSLSTPEGREAELRRNFPVGKPGEGVIILVGTSSDR